MKVYVLSLHLEYTGTVLSVHATVDGARFARLEYLSECQDETLKACEDGLEIEAFEVEVEAQPDVR